MRKITFYECLMEAARWPYLIEGFDRMLGCSLSPEKLAARAPLDTMIDNATGKLDYDLSMFIAFVYDIVWTRLPLDLRDMENGPTEDIAIPLREWEKANSRRTQSRL